jgi:hypothetical protein
MGPGVSIVRAGTRTVSFIALSCTFMNGGLDPVK